MKPKSVHLEVKEQVEIGLPQEIMDELSMDSGDEAIVSVQGGMIIIAPKNANPWDRLAGLWKDMWPVEEDPQDYVNRMRDEWD